MFILQRVSQIRSPNCLAQPLRPGTGALHHFTFSITIRAGLLNFFRSRVQRAVWQHGATADKLTATRGHWTVEDLAAKIGNARRKVTPPRG
jgi:hypothetical protein